MISAFFAGLVLGWVYFKTRSLWVVIILHVVNNLIAFSLGDYESTAELLGDNAMYLGALLIALIVAAIGFSQLKKRRLENN